MAQTDARPIIIKRIKKSGAGHHGGAWKVAYADFTTAMMAFFMLLWLLNVTTKEQKEGLSNYFAPTAASKNASGSGGVLGGQSMSKDGQQDSGTASVAMPNTADAAKDSAAVQIDAAKTPQQIEEEAWQRAAAQREETMFDQTEAELRQSIQEMADLNDMAQNLAIDVTKDGMRIQLIDNDKRSMFKDGSPALYAYAQKMLERIAISINKLPNRIAITGHTDGKPFERSDGYSNWELSTDRANAARRILLGAHVSADRFSEVQGKANTDPLIPDNPGRSENRRISILLIREAPVMPTDKNP